MFPPPTLGAETPRSALLRPCGGDYRRPLIFMTNAPRRRAGLLCRFIRRALGEVRCSDLSL